MEPLVAQTKAVATFLNTLPAKPSLSQFADALQKNEGMRKTIPDIDNQVDALRKFEKGQLSYAEMRALCG
jgi:hypothetical protein